jgi:multiple sugar transport system substrate-binding protein
MSLKRLFGAGLAMSMLLSLGAGCSGGGGEAPGSEPVKLDYWRVFDGEDTFTDIIKSYKTSHPNVTIIYRRLRSEEYETELIRAFAEGQGPDIFSVHNTKIGEMQSLMQPLPASVQVSHLETVGTLRKEVVFVESTKPTMSEKTLKQQFVDVVASDVLRPYQADTKTAPVNRIYGLPLSVDTLALFYNKDLLNAAGIAEPPSTWEEFQEAVTKLTVIDAAGNITQSGAALGTTDNVERSADILSLLMLQNGTVMTTGNSITFNEIPDGTPEGLFPGVDAARFYTDFANPTKEVYSWNDTLPGSFEAFANGQTAMFFGYSYHLPYIAAAAPKLNFAIAKMPQIAGGREVNYGNYWVEGVANNSDAADYAWDFIQFASSEEQAAKYLTKARKPTALRGLINTQLNDENMGPFAEQVLTAESWYKGRDADAMEKALNDFSDQVLAGGEAEEAVEQAAQVVRQTY